MYGCCQRWSGWSLIRGNRGYEQVERRRWSRTGRSADADVNIYGHTAHTGCIGKPISCATGTGKCTVVVNGGQVGPLSVATEGMNRSKEDGGPVPEGLLTRMSTSMDTQLILVVLVSPFPALQVPVSVRLLSTVVRLVPYPWQQRV